MYEVMITYGSRGDNAVDKIEFKRFSTLRKAKQYIKLCAEDRSFLSGEVKDKNAITKFELWWKDITAKQKNVRQ